MYTRYLNLFYLVITFIFSCKSISNKGDVAGKDTVIATIIDTSILKSKGKSALDLFIESYTDSINRAEIIKKLPDFLEDSQFDYNNSGIWSPSHHPLPLRYMIINKVNSCVALRMLLDSGNPKYKIKPKKYHDIDVEYSDMSFFQLSEIRYKELRCLEREKRE